MNGCAIQQNVFAACEEMRVPFSVAERKDPVICPKPRRLSQLASVDPVRPLRRNFCQQGEPFDLRASAEILDIFVPKGAEQFHSVDSSPPFFCGSPPSRSPNPVVHDARFGEVTPLNDLVPSPNSFGSPMPASGSRKGCTRSKFGLAPAAIRIEGFDCLDRDRSRSRGIPAVA